MRKARLIVAKAKRVESIVAGVMGLVWTLCVATSSAQFIALSTAFTYQGRLDSSGTPTTGLHDFRFRLYDNPVAGNQIGATQCADNVSVAADGTFSVPIDFGAVFGPFARFVEIEVRRDTGLGCANLTGYTLLTPRQSVLATPIASHALHANALDAPDGNPVNAVFVGNSGRVGIGTTTPQGPIDIVTPIGSYVRIDEAFGDVHFNGGTDGFFGLYNDSGLSGRTEFVSSNGVNLSIGNNGSIGMGTLPVAGTRLKAAGVVEADEFRFAAPQTIYITVGSESFTPTVGETVGEPFNGTGRYTSGTEALATSVNLPEGMTITEIRWFVNDASSSNISCIFIRRALPSGGSSFLSQSISSGTPGVTTLTGTLNHVVANQDAKYTLIARPLVQGTSWDSGRIGIQGVTIVGTIRNPR